MGRTSFSFDAASRLRQVITPSGLGLSYAYDTVGQRSYLIDPEGLRFTYVYDVAGRITNLVNSQGQITTWGYDVTNRRASMRLANATRTSYSYDAANRLMRLVNVGTGGATLSSFQYTVDAVGNRQRVVESSGDVVTWTYDNFYQLTRELRSGVNSYAVTYSYDAVGNRLVKEDGGALTTYGYDAGNQLIRREDSTGFTTYTFDGNGNQLLTQSASNQRTTNTWDPENRLIQVALPSGIIDTFTYNGDGKRVTKVDSTGLTNFIWDLENVLAETNASNAIQAMYCFEPAGYGNLISQVRSSTSSFYHFDGLGSTDCLTNVAGSVTDTYLSDAFGNPIEAGQLTSNPFRYFGRIGYQYDSDVTLYYLRARYYDDKSGRFLTRDSLIERVLRTLYAYVLNNPTNYADPSGFDGGAISIPIGVIGGGGAVVGGGAVAGGGAVVVGGAIAAGAVALMAVCLGPFFNYALTQMNGPWRNDKTAHCYVACAGTKACTALIPQVGGFTFELYQAVAAYLRLPLGGDGFSVGDIAANAQGSACAGWESCILGPIGFLGGYFFRQSCEDCCKSAYPPAR